MVKGSSKELKVLGKEVFFQMRGTVSSIDPKLTELEYYCLCRQKEGYSVSYLARKVFCCHVTTLQKALSSVAYVDALHQVNTAQETVTYQLCMRKLTDIILHSNNDGIVIQAIKTACQLMPLITMSELEEALKVNNLDEEEARELLAKFSSKEGVADGKEEDCN